MFSRLFSIFHPKEQENTPMWILVGLGNPGTEHQHDRHNIGFMAIDAIAKAHDITAFKSRFKGDVAEGRIAGERVALAKPMTYMNLSGECIGQLARYYKVTQNRIIVFHDELDLAPFKLRVKKGGGAAGHNGLKSLDAHLETPEYWRVRLGIGHPGDRDRVTGYVLGPFGKDEKPYVAQWMDVVAKNIPLMLQQKHEDFMTKMAADFAAPDQKNKE
jgi:peptidyl-tRNA hydrolase, PTH1 family